MTLEQLLGEIRRVADETGHEPCKLPRSVWAQHTRCTPHSYERFGTWGQVRNQAAIAAGEPPHPRDLGPSQGLRDEQTYTRKLERELGRQEYFLERLRFVLADTFERYPIELTPKPATWASSAATKRLLTMLLSDLHFGVEVDPREVLGSRYNWTIASRRMAKLCVQAAEWKPEHRDETDLAVVLNGDLIEGVIHLHDEGIRPLAEQWRGATEILVNALDFLREHFRTIDVYCLPGNHDRHEHKGKGRSTSQRWDHHADAIYLGLQQAFRAEPRVRFHVPRSGLATYTTPGGHLIGASHGDTAPTIANLGKSINVERIEGKLNRIETSGVYDRPFGAYLFGHWHTPATIMLPQGTTVVVNGSLIGGASYSQHGCGILDPMPAQVIFESAEHYPFGDSRIVHLRDADGRGDLDEILRPPDGTFGLS